MQVRGGDVRGGGRSEGSSDGVQVRGGARAVGDERASAKCYSALNGKSDGQNRTEHCKDSGMVS